MYQESGLGLFILQNEVRAGAPLVLGGLTNLSPLVGGSMSNDCIFW